ncbi:YadA-like family protein [Moraxella sp. FZFQ2102]|uniref:ESPR-type extended signal peptide-containing protein n=1 Tax=Moraxella sp. FZFQ2102 TaxID=2953752 RepID=UPI00209C57AE|nr:ESPR-type extended signal peptide-containing protein [Moraxella sp. FZFQ2102]USZ15567.1 YadA-like family protein [Moraxella sp. FZFQ2102]
MNKAFKVIWNHATQSWTAVSEIARAKGKTKSVKTAKTVLAAAITTVAISGTAQAATATADTPQSGTTLIDTSPEGAIAIGAGAKTLAPGDNAWGSIAIGKNATAKGVLLAGGGELPAIAIGQDASAIDSGTALGLNAKADNGQQAVAIGTNANASADRSVAVGVATQATAQQAAAMGWNAKASGVSSLSLGTNSTSSGDYSVAISGNSTSSGAYSIANGYYANAAGKNSVAVGAQTGAGAERATAVGYYSKAQALDAAVLGSVANASAVNATAIGRFANAMKTDSIAVGTFTHTPTVEAVAIGTNSATGVTRAEWDNLNALHEARLEQDEIWAKAVADADAQGLTGAARETYLDQYRPARNAAHGAENAARSALAAATTTKGEIVIGSHSLAKGNDSIIVGNNNTITTANTFVLGKGINRGADLTTDGSGTVANSVYLGNESEATAGKAVGTTLLKINQEAGGTTTTAGDTGTVTNATVGGVTYGGFAGATANGVVTVGASGAERRIQNVAAGEISATSTDAINGSQLYLVTKGTLDQFPVIYTDADGNKLVKAPDGNFYPADTVLIDGKYYPRGTTPEQVADGTATPATPVDAGDVIASMNDGDNVADSPKTLANVKGNLTPTYNVGDMTINATTGVPSDVASTEYTKSQTGPNATTAAAMYNNAATVGDVLNAGWNLKVNDEAVDFVKPYDTVAFVNGTGTTARIDYTNGTQSNITFDINVDGTTTEITYVDAAGNTVTKVGDKFYNPADLNADGTPKADAKPVENVVSRISAIAPTFTANADPANATTSGLNFVNTPTTSVKVDGNNVTVDVNTGVINPEEVDGVQTGKVTGPVTPALTEALEAAEEALAALPDTATEAEKKAAQDAVDAAQAAITNAGNAVATAQNVADMINASGWNTNSTTATGGAKNTLVNPGDQVNFEAGNNMQVTQEINTTTGVISYTYATKDDLVLNSTTIGGSYTNEAGELITTSPITIMTTPEGKNVINNLTTVLPPTTSIGDNPTKTPTKDDGSPFTAQDAQDLAKTSGTNAATLGDVLNAGWNLKVNDEAVDFVKPYDTVAFVNGTGTTARIDYTNGTQSNVTFDINVDDKTITIGEDGKLTAITPAPVIITKEGPINLENTNTTRIEVNQTTGNVSVNVNTGTSKVDENGKAVPNTTVDAGRIATIGDITTTINQTGWNVLNNAGERVDRVNPADNVQFKQGTGTQVTVTSEDGKTSVVTYSTKIDGKTIKADTNGTLYVDMPAPTIITKDGTLNFENTETATIVTNPTTGNISVKVETGVASVSDGAAKDADGKTVPAGKAIADANNANKVATVGNIVDVINNSGFGLLANGTNASTVNPGDTVDLKNTDGNVVITKAADSNDVEFNLAKNITIGQSVTAPTVNVGGDAGNTALTTVAGGNYNSAGQKIDDTAVPALSVGGSQITNVANGAISPSSTDAINGSQLYAVQNNFNQQIGAVNNRIDDLDSNRKAGSASAMAAAGLPQAYREGQSGFVAAVGQYEGETGVAVGFTSISDNGKWLFRGAYSTNTQNENAGNLGLGYFW